MKLDTFESPYRYVCCEFVMHPESIGKLTEHFFFNNTTPDGVLDVFYCFRRYSGTGVVYEAGVYDSCGWTSTIISVFNKRAFPPFCLFLTLCDDGCVSPVSPEV